MKDTSIKDTLAEGAILGAIILNNSLLEDIELEIDDFYTERNRAIFKAINELYNAGMSIDFVTLNDKLSQLGQLEEVGGLMYIMGLPQNASVGANVVEHAEILKRKKIARRYARAADQLKAMCYGGSSIEDMTSFIQSVNVDSRCIKGCENILDVFKANHAIIEAKLNDEYSGIPTGYTDLDNMLGGLQKSDLIVLGARSSMGKTTFALNIAANVGILENKKVLVFSLEMSSGQLVHRIVSSVQGIKNTHLLRPKQMTDTEWDQYWKTAEKLKDKNFFIYDNGDVRPSKMRKIIKQFKAKHGLDLVVIDYLQLMASDEKHNGNKVQEVSEITRSLKLMAREFDIPVILLSQLSRGVEGRTDKRPIMSDLRDSGSIEQDADIIIFLYRDGYYNKECQTPFITELIVAKHRNGPLGTVKLYFDGETTAFHDFIDMEE